ncbi:MAG: UDP-N-acetylglucosamine 1-carboxyvinyltransferase [Alphaproteobacteria bacterium]
MDLIRIRGGQPLAGEIVIGGAKNAALPLMAAALLTEEPLVLDNLPALADIASMAALLLRLGVAIDEVTDPDGRHGRTFRLRAATVADTTAPYDLVRKMRASVLVLGPLVARCGHAEVSLPGGCAIGTRPIDLHLKGLESLGARIDLRDGYVIAKAPPGGLRGAHIQFPFVSVGATENALMASTLAAGDTVLTNAAREPEITDLAHCLNAMGARIEGIGTDTLRITGVARLRAARYAVVADRIEAGTFAMAAAATGGDVELIGARLDHLETVAAKLTETGVALEPTARGLRVRRGGGPLGAADVTTQPHPGFPTDLQAQMMSLLTVAEGASVITETIFENRFMHVPELARMGAEIVTHGATATVRGVARLRGAPVMATDLRASVGLVIAGLMAEGETIVHRVYHLDRGYERLVEKLAACGAEIVREPAP